MLSYLKVYVMWKDQDNQSMGGLHILNEEVNALLPTANAIHQELFKIPLRNFQFYPQFSCIN